MSVLTRRDRVREEGPGELIVVLPHAGTSEGWSEELLGLAIGGGDADSQSGQLKTGRDNIYG